MAAHDSSDAWRVRVAARCVVGPLREHNEDSVAVLVPGAGVVDPSGSAALATDRGVALLVIDGMGGQHSGDVACRLLVESLALALAAPLPGDPGERGAWLQGALRRASAHVEAHATPHAGQAATAALAVVYGDTVHLVHAGDARVYLLRDGRLTQRTRDDSLAERLRDRGAGEDDLRGLPRGLLTQMLGAPGCDPHLDQFTAAAGDVLLLCSDGLHEHVAPEEIAAALRASDDLPAICDALVALAVAAPSDDNITAMLARIERAT